MMFSPLSDRQRQYYERQDVCWRIYVKQCCDRNDLDFLTYAEWLFIHESEVDHPEVKQLRDRVRVQCRS